MWGPFHNKSGVIVNSENVWANDYVQNCVTKKPIFVSERVIFLTKFGNTAFQCLFPQIIRIWELFFQSVGSYFFVNFNNYNGKSFFCLEETSFF